MKKFYKFFFLLILIDMFLLGTGRILTFGPITVRQILFFSSILFYVFYTFKYNKLNIGNYFIVIVYIIFLLINYIIEINNGITFKNTIMESSFSFYILYIVTLAPIIDLSEFKKKDIFMLLITISAIISLFCIFMFLIVKLGMYEPYVLRAKLYNISTNDFGVRNNGGFFFTGLFYVFIASVLLTVKLFKDGLLKSEKIVYVLNIFALIQSSTRGFIYLLFFIFIINLLIFFRLNKKNIVIIPLLIFLAIGLITINLDIIIEFINHYVIRETLSEDGGIQKRLNILNSMNINEMNLMFGQGFNKSINYNGASIKHFEISYIEIIIKQGVTGLFFWIMVYVNIILKLYKKYRRNKSDFISIGIFISLVAIMLLSFTNPYLTVSMGLFFLAIAYNLKYLEV